MSIKVLLWDVDGTLLSFAKAEAYAIRKCFDIFNLGTCTDEMLARYSEINVGYWERLERGEMTKPQILDGRFIDFFTECGIDASKAHEFNAEYQIRLGDNVYFMDGAEELIKEYADKYKQYVVTNGTIEAQTRKLAASGIRDIAHGCFISDEIGCEKPTHGFFEKVWETIFEEIGECDKREVMIIGDSLTSDMQGGINEGFVTCWYNPECKENKRGLELDYEIRDLNEIREILNNIN